MYPLGAHLAAHEIERDSDPAAPRCLCLLALPLLVLQDLTLLHMALNRISARGMGQLHMQVEAKACPQLLYTLQHVLRTTKLPVIQGT